MVLVNNCYEHKNACTNCCWLLYSGKVDKDTPNKEQEDTINIPKIIPIIYQYIFNLQKRTTSLQRTRSLVLMHSLFGSSTVTVLGRK